MSTPPTFKPAAMPRWRQYWVLTKPRVTQLAVFCAVIGMFLATPGMVPYPVLFGGIIGIWFMELLQPFNNVANFGNVCGLCSNLYMATKASNATEYCNWRPLWCNASSTRLGGSDQYSVCRSLAFSVNYFRMDATTLLGTSFVPS